MTDSDQPPAPGRLSERLGEAPPEETIASLDRLTEADPDTRKRSLRAVRNIAEDRPSLFDGLAEAFARFLTDSDRAVRLTTAKLFVALARSDPAVVVPAVGTLASRVADDGEFYYVRARCVEALGYVALDHPDVVGDPEILADFRVGLSFDEPEVKEKLAKALAYVTLGDPGRLRHHVESLADHLADDSELVRYQLGTAVVTIGCEHPEAVAAATDALRDRLDDDNSYVRGRAAEALALLAASDHGSESLADLAGIEPAPDDPPAFSTERVAFLRKSLEDGQDASPPDGVGTVDSVRTATDNIAETIDSPDSETECPHCGLELPDCGPPMCPQCGAPR
ncbi:HEAT repeat domain-containing protein [Haloarcula halophila]|uniref:HEAT repeat domain-containing protein n=1 Tax=Haloarcula TaxID=2237 RepID=UPI0023E396BE|nr:HEAT repeat domain-containing protein [Halomicroarcula sp. DFY41]